MKLGRVLFLGTVVMAVLLLAAIGVAFTSGFQTWAARKALAGQPGLDLTLGRVSAGLNRVRLENVRMVRDGAVLTLPTAEVELPVLSAVLRQKVLVRRFEARGWTLDLTQAQLPPATTAAASPPPQPREFSLVPAAYADVANALPPAVFAGIFSQIKLPVDLALDGVDLSGEVLLPARSGRPAARAQVTITGGRLAAGHPGEFDYTATILFAGDAAAVHELEVRGTLGVVMNSPRTFTRLVVATAAEATGPKFPGGVRLAIDVSAAQSAAGENYAMAVLSGAKQLAVAEATYAAGESHLRGTWRVDMHDTDLAPFVLGRELPVFEAVGEGRFDLDTTFTELNASGRLNTTADRLGDIKPALAVLGSVQLAAEFDLSQHGNATRVDRLAVTITGAKPVGTVQALQAFEFNLRTGELNVADPAKDLLGIAFQDLPLAWVSPLLGNVGFTLTGNELQGEFVASARNGGFALRPKAPLTIGNLSVTLNDGRPLLHAVDITLTASADYTPQGWQVELAPLSVSSNGAALFTLEAKAGQLAGKDQPVKMAGKWTAQLPALLAQPAVGAAMLTGGESRGDFVASLGAKREIQARIELANLVNTTAAALPALTADLRADVEADGRITFNAPLRFEQEGRKSDLTLAGTLVPGTGGPILNAHLTSDWLVIDDVKTFALPFVTPPAEPAVNAAYNFPAHRAMPIWRGLRGQCILALKKVDCTGQFQVTDVSGMLQLEADACKLVDARAVFGPDSVVRLSGGLTFNPAGPQPYGLAADFALDNFDLTAVLRKLNPGKPPTLEGRFNLQSHLTGDGTTLVEVADRTRGDLRMSSKSGIFRALSADMSDRIQKTQSRVAAIGNFLGVLTDDYVNKTKILADIAKSLAEIPYDQLSVTATRDDLLNLVIKDFTLISPEVRLGGSGVIRYAPGVPVAAQPFELQLTLGARGRLGDLMKRAGLLDVQQDNLGYAAFAVPLKLGGTLARPDTGAIRDALLNSALERTGLLDSILGRGK